ncbi:MAG: hypothetical protein R3D28_26045, partial [Geminicoccaceae bacterium]
RADAGVRERFAGLGLDPDQGMLVETGGRLFHGADALHALSLMSSGRGWLDRLCARLFAHRWSSRIAYPLLRAGRNATLLALGRAPMAREDPGEAALFTLFSFAMGLFGLMHVMNYAFEYGRFLTPTIWPILVPAIGLIFHPGSRRLFVLLLVTLAINAWAQAPMASNHTLILSFLLLACLAAGFWHGLRGGRFLEFFADVAPVGRVLLLVMYVYGIFHKINADFLNPEVSCAVTLWRAMPPPLRWLDAPWVHYATIYGTFVVEGVIFALLLTPRLRRFGIVGGIGFHMLLAQSGHALYAAFSTLSLSLHILFLAPAAALRITGHPTFRAIFRQLRSPWGIAAFALVLLLITVNAFRRDFGLVGLTWCLLALPLVVAILFLPGRVAPTVRRTPLLWSRLAWLNVVGLLFALNNALPYLGLKTAQTINMFANLRLEGGVSNHLVLPGPPGPFGYLADVVTLEKVEGAPYLAALGEAGYGVVWYQFLDLVGREPDAVVTYSRGGAHVENATAASLAAARAAVLHPEWLRKWFHFRRVDLRLPKPCSD